MNARRLILLAAGIVLIGVVAAFVTIARSREGAEAAPPSEQAVPVAAGEVSRRDVPIVIEALGTVTPIETIAVQSRVNGQIMQAFFHQGKLVKKGDPLFLIDPRPYQAALDQAQAQLRSARGGMAPVDAIHQACLQRFRPIMMTTVCALVAGLPLALGHGAGSELRRPLGIAIIGGLLVSQWLTLYTTPIVYLYLDRLNVWMSGLAPGRRARPSATNSAAGR